jgi:type I restriction enzyme S subunit
VTTATLPKGWTEVALGDVCDVQSGFAFDSKRFTDRGGIPIIRIRDVIRGESATRYVGEYDPRFLVHDGDLLVGMDGEFNRATWRGGEALLNQRVSRIASAGRSLDDRYLFHFLPGALKRIEDDTPFVTVKHLSSKVLKSIAIPLPPIEEQRRIAAVLDQADELRAKRRSALALLDTLTESIFLDRFAGFAGRTALGDIAEVQGGVQVTTKRSSHPIEVPYLRVANVYRSRLDLREIKTIRVTKPELERVRLRTGDLLVVEAHGNPDEVGRVAQWDGVVRECVHQNHLIRVRVHPDQAHPTFIERFMNSAIGRRGLQRAANTTSGLNGISASDVRSVAVPLPPRSEQQAFAELVAGVKHEQSQISSSMAELDDLFASLQQRAFRGEL